MVLAYHARIVSDIKYEIYMHGCILTSVKCIAKVFKTHGRHLGSLRVSSIKYYNITLDDFKADTESDNWVNGFKKIVPLCHIIMYIIIDDMSFVTRDVKKY